MGRHLFREGGSKEPLATQISVKLALENGIKETYFFPRPSNRMDPLEIYISCRKCKKDFVIKNLAKHAEKNRDCNQTYTQDQISDLKDLSKEVSKAKKRMKDAERYLKKKEELAEKYQQKKNKLLKSIKKKRANC